MCWSKSRFRENYPGRRPNIAPACEAAHVVALTEAAYRSVEQHSIIDKVDGSITVMTVEIAFDNFRSGPGYASVLRYRYNKGISAFFRKGKPAGMIVIDSEEVGCPRNQLDTRR